MRWGRPGEPIDERDTFLPLGDTWRWWKGTADPAPAPDPADSSSTVGWTDPAYPDDTWASSKAAFGYGAGTFSTTLPDMKGSYASVLFRRKFTVPDGLFDVVSDTVQRLRVKRLYLEVRWDDGFRAFLNGTPVAARNLPRSALASTPALVAQEPGRKVFDITGSKDLLLRGASANLIALEVHTASLDAPGCLFDARVFWGIEGLGDDESLSRIPDGRLGGGDVKVPREFATPGAENHLPPGYFRRGDANGDGLVDLSDAVRTLVVLFLEPGGPGPCPDAMDTDNGGSVDVGDVVALLEFLYRGGPAPPAPGPTSCGPDSGPPDTLPDCVSQACD
jgi:hypothetical protein